MVIGWSFLRKTGLSPCWCVWETPLSPSSPFSSSILDLGPAPMRSCSGVIPWTSFCRTTVSLNYVLWGSGEGWSQKAPLYCPCPSSPIWTFLQYQSGLQKGRVPRACGHPARMKRQVFWAVGEHENGVSWALLIAHCAAICLAYDASRSKGLDLWAASYFHQQNGDATFSSLVSPWLDEDWLCHCKGPWTMRRGLGSMSWFKLLLIASVTWRGFLCPPSLLSSVGRMPFMSSFKTWHRSCPPSWYQTIHLSWHAFPSI